MSKKLIPHPVIGTPDENWNNNAIQFPRLLAELQAAGAFTNAVINSLTDSMDLDPSQVFEIIDRAQFTWDDIVIRTHNPGSGDTR